MAPTDYMTIRTGLGRGSGQESPGFRTMVKLPGEVVWPAVTAFLFTRDPLKLTLISWSTGALASAIGLWISYSSDLPTGPTIVCSYGLVLLAAGAVRRLKPETAAA